MDTASRLWEIDGARGIAILMMVLFHTVFDLSFFSVYPVNVATGFWRYFAYSTASLFLIIVGISLVVSHARAAAKLSGFSLVRKYLLRGAGIFVLALLVTFATWLYLHEGYVIFGILHLIGVSVILSVLFFRFKKLNILLGFACIGMGLGEILYTDGVRQFSLRPLPGMFQAPFTFLGRHSLVIYLVHQPVIILLLALVTGTKVL